MSNTVMGLAIMAVVAAAIGFSFFRGARAKPTTGNGGDPGGGAGGWDGSHGHSDGGGGDGGGGD